MAVGEKYGHLKQVKEALVCIANAQMMKTRPIGVSEGRLHIGNQGEEEALDLTT